MRTRFSRDILRTCFPSHLMPYVQTAVLEFLKEQNSQCNQIRQSEFQIKVLPHMCLGLQKEQEWPCLPTSIPWEKHEFSSAPSNLGTEELTLFSFDHSQQRQQGAVSLAVLLLGHQVFCSPVVLFPAVLRASSVLMARGAGFPSQPTLQISPRP